MFSPEYWGAACCIIVLLSGIIVLLQQMIMFRIQRRRLERNDASLQDRCPATPYDPQFADLFERLAGNPTYQQIRAAGQAAAEMLVTLCSESDAKGLLHPSTLYDNWSRVDPTCWKPACEDAQYRALLCFGSVHPNGYLREKCLRELLKRTDAPVALPFVLMRVNDWVPVIREAAVQSLPRLIRYASAAELLHALPFFENLRRAGRVSGDAGYDPDAIELMLAERLAADAEVIRRQPIRIRHCCYGMLFSTKDWQKCHAILLDLGVNTERDGVLRDRLTMLYLQRTPVIPQLAELCKSKRWRIRLQACERRFQEEGIWGEEFLTLLQDPSVSIREFAAFHLREAGREAQSLAYCRGNLPTCISALGEIGSKEDIPLIRSYQETSPAACLYALVKLGAPDAVFLVWDALHSENPQLARCAFRIARAKRMRFDLEEMRREMRCTEDPILQWRLFHLLRGTRDWRVLPELLHMLRDCPTDRNAILGAICHRDPYPHFLTPELAEKIENAIVYAGDTFPEPLADDLRFDLRRFLS